MNLALLLSIISAVIKADLLKKHISTPASFIKALATNGNLKKIDVILKINESVPLVKLEKPSTFKPISHDLFVKGLEFSYMPMCSKANLLKKLCICDTHYTNVRFAYSVEYQSNALLAYHNETRQLVVSYKYTSNARNWLTNFDYLLTEMEGAPKGVKVHHGMYRHYLAIHDETMELAAKIFEANDVKSIFVTGYSLGGSVAVISAPYWAKFKETHDVPINIVSYSGTRTGNLEAKLYFESLGLNLIHYTNKNDAIPNLPPRFAGYVHAGLEIHERAITSFKTELVVCRQEFDEDPNCLYGEPGRKNAALHYTPFNNLLLLPPYCSSKSITNLPLPEYANWNQTTTSP